MKVPRRAKRKRKKRGTLSGRTRGKRRKKEV